MSHEPMKIGILGGTFDPIHEGHLALARAARAQYDLNRILFIPVNIPPHKTIRLDMASGLDRYKMVELALQGEQGFEASKIEIERPGVSYSIETLKTLLKMYPQARFYMILGADAFSQFETWREADEIRRHVIFLVASRPGTQKQNKDFSEKILPIEMPHCEVASTGIRAAVREPSYSGGNVPQNVLEYIRKNRLYI